VLDDGSTIPFKITKQGTNIRLTPEQAEIIWNSKWFNNFIKSTLNIDINRNPDLINAYLQLFATDNKIPAVTELMKLAGEITFNQYINQMIINDLTDSQKENTSLLKRIITRNYSGFKDKPNKVPTLKTSLGLCNILSPDSQAQLLTKLAMARCI